MKLKGIGILAFVVGLFLSISTIGQTPLPAPVGSPTSIFTVYDGTLKRGEYTFSASSYDPEVQTLKLTSKLMARDVPYRVILPIGYATSKDRYPVIYFLHGLSGHYDNWTDKTKIAEYAAPYKFIIVTPEGGDGWYTDNPVNNDKYESYIIKELIPEIDTKFRTIADRDHRMITGLSMGGYGSLKFGLKYPELFSLAGSFSGALGASSYRTADELPSGDIRTGLLAIFGQPESDIHKANDLFKIIKELTPEKIKTLPFIYQACGTEDFLFQNNHDFEGLLVLQKVPHEYRELPGAHTWDFWDNQAREFLYLADARLKSAAAKSAAK